MQSFSLMRRWHSSSVSLPSFLRWEGASEVVDFEAPEELEGLLFLLSELLPLLSFSLDLPLELEELAELLALEAEGVEEFLVWREISDLHSQYLASMVCARVRNPSRVWGFLTREISSLRRSGRLL